MASLRCTLVRPNWPLRMRGINSMPELGTAASRKRLNPGIHVHIRFDMRMMLLRQIVQMFRESQFGRRGSDSSVFIFWTARHDAALLSTVIVAAARP